MKKRFLTTSSARGEHGIRKYKVERLRSLEVDNEVGIWSGPALGSAYQR
jgi:hypothetical protein